MTDPDELLRRNACWAARKLASDPEFFSRLKERQAPKYLWIGCSDSRVPATEIVDVLPGEIFVHRNVANQVGHTDINCLSALHYAVNVLYVEHIIVCGHYGCGGVEVAADGQGDRLIDAWLRPLHEIGNDHEAELAVMSDGRIRRRRLCEINVLTQLRNVCNTTVVTRAWSHGQTLSVHGWIYDAEDGLLHERHTAHTSGSSRAQLR
ncbi:MAG: carbonic anhydrase [Gammaproteobacteria bacterium]|jgi:carbonic anhydrase